MANNERRSDSLNEALKRREAAGEQHVHHEGEPLALDDTQRVKVLSPGRLVAKRFFRNKLAIVGLAILIFMFVFAFIFPLFYPYTQTQIFYKYGTLNSNYASATERTEYVSYSLGDDISVSKTVKNSMNSYIRDMNAQGLDEMQVTDSEGTMYTVSKLTDNIYTLAADDLVEVARYSGVTLIASYDKIHQAFTYTDAEAFAAEAADGEEEPAAEGEEPAETEAVSAQQANFEAAAAAAIEAGEETFTSDGVTYSVEMTVKNKYSITRESSVLLGIDGFVPDQSMTAEVEAAIENGQTNISYNGESYRIAESGGAYYLCTIGEPTDALVSSTLVFDSYDTSVQYSDEFKAEALLAAGRDGEFEYDGQTYTVSFDGESGGISDAAGNEIVSLGTFVVRRYSGQDTLPIDFKEATQDVIAQMEADGVTKTTFVHAIPQTDEESSPVYDEEGNPVLVDTEITVERKTSEYVLSCDQTTYLIDIYAGPSAEHWFGTDGDGMDILARMMYGGRISLMIGFVVVFLETLIGVILGGLAGFFGRWVDTLIMRLVDIFYCIPTYPILIIMGALFDALKMDPYVRLVWMMVALGLLGWAGIARLVRGQILSLREQEFMIAEEATGIRSSRRIFRHLVPNVMPQLIVNATMSLGSVIITEATLSFLGLGVKHPLATWGNMINSVTGSSESMLKYTYIWVPVGLLICLTVVAFNFVGDGLRDAFDPKMKQ